MDLTEKQIEKVLNDYKKRRERENKYYHEVCKNNEEFMIKNRERAKNHYHQKGKDMKKEQYEDNKEFIKSKSHYMLIIRERDKLDTFKEKHEAKCKILTDKGFPV
jgi:hypothetical protein